MSTTYNTNQMVLLINGRRIVDGAADDAVKVTYKESVGEITEGINGALMFNNMQSNTVDIEVKVFAGTEDAKFLQEIALQSRRGGLSKATLSVKNITTGEGGSSEVGMLSSTELLSYGRNQDGIRMFTLIMGQWEEF